MVTERKVDVSNIIDGGKISGYQALVIFMCGIIALLDGFDTQSISFVASEIAQQWDKDVKTFGPIFSAGLFGIMIGSMTFGPLADKFGRKKLLILSMLFMGTFSLLTTQATSVEQLLMYRLLTGIGIGGAMPNMMAMTAEYSPKRARNTAVTIMFCGFPMGAILGGLVMAPMIPKHGWEIVFYIGGIVPLLFIPIMIVAFPESIRFLVTKGNEGKKVAKILNKMAYSHQYQENNHFVLPENNSKISQGSVKNLFTQGLARNTLLIWIVFFMNLLIFYSLINWMPSILVSAGIPIEKAIIAVVLLNLGGIVGGIVLGRLTDNSNKQPKILSLSLSLGAVMIGVTGFLQNSITLLMIATFLSGFLVMGVQMGAQAIATSLYPTSIRSTGVGWAFGVGRIGSIIGPLIAGLMLGLQLELKTIFLVVAVPAVLSSLAISLLQMDQSKIEISKNDQTA